MKSIRNRTLLVSDAEKPHLRKSILEAKDVTSDNYLNSTILGDCLDVFERLPSQIADMAIVDPPYNLSKKVGKLVFKKISVYDYTVYLQDILKPLSRLLKPTASLYICGDWYMASSIFDAASSLFKVRNRITWGRKAPAAKYNYKNACEDIWFCTVSNDYVFNADAVKSRRKVLSTYVDPITKNPIDWERDSSGQAWRDEGVSNFWTDLVTPFWSMPENTIHPTQKSEKFSAKLILASSNPGDVILSPFLGSGSDSVVAKKLGRQYIGIELQEDFALTAQKRLNAADNDSRIQGYHDGVFWERNSRRNVKCGENAAEERQSRLRLP